MVQHTVPIIPDYGRADACKVSVLSGGLLPEVLRQKWPDLAGGSVIRAECPCGERAADNGNALQTEERFYISSIVALPENAARLAEVIRVHLENEDRLQWALDIRFSQDRLQENDPHCIACCRALSRLALSFIEFYRFWLWNTDREKRLLSVNEVQQRCSDPGSALECLAVGLRLI